jgi:hypothetical protein
METVRIANCSGFLGDRRSAAREMVEGGPIDYLTGDYLAELTMALLWRVRRRHPDRGYARVFLTQLEEVLGMCLDRGIRIVVDAGGLDPGGLAEAVRATAARLGLSPRVGWVGGDDLMTRLDQVDVRSFADDQPLEAARITPLTANAYLGSWGIVRALQGGADIVVTGRVTDAALVIGPAAHHFGWARDDWDRLAGALVAGHVIECGAQVTGGNYSFFDEVPGLDHPGFPLVEMTPDGSFVVTKHPGTGGLVSVGTVTAQLLYEIGGARYASPDVTARFDTIHLEGQAPDRVAVTGVRGEPPPPRLKVALNHMGGFRNRVTFVLTGLDIEQKAAVAASALFRAVGGRDTFARAAVDLIRSDHPDPHRNDEAMAHLRVTVEDDDPDRVGRSFSDAAVSLALASYPGFFMTEPPADASPLAVYWPATVDPAVVPSLVEVEGQRWEVSSVPAASRPLADLPPPAVDPPRPPDELVDAPLGRVVGTRSGDKGGDANVGVWARHPDAFPWLVHHLTVGEFCRLVPEAEGLVVRRHIFPNLGAVNFVVEGLLGRGAAASHRYDAQAKSLGEYLRCRIVAIPATLFRPPEGG